MLYFFVIISLFATCFYRLLTLHVLLGICIRRFVFLCLQLSFASAAFASTQIGIVVFFVHKIRARGGTDRIKVGASVSSQATLLERKRA